MKTLILATVAALFCVSVFADKYALPTRKFPGGFVSLAPLLKWWKEPPVNPEKITSWRSNPAVTNYLGQRPMKSWKLIRGKVVDVKPYAFIVEADVFTSPFESTHQRIYLYNAPLQEKATFEELTNRQAFLMVRQGWATSAASASSYARDNAKFQEGVAGIVQQNSSPGVARNIQGNINAYDEQAYQSQQNVNRAVVTGMNIQQELSQIKTALDGYPSHSEYIVEWFALDRGREFYGLPLYDCGFPY